MPERAPVDESLREALLDQLTYLIDEIEALKDVVGGIPEPLETARPLPSDSSIREYYGLLAAYDEKVYLPRLRLLAGRGSRDPVPEDDRALAAGWNEHPLDAILERVQEARRSFVDALQGLPLSAWTREVFALAHAATQHDVDVLRAVSQRLYEGR